MGSCDQARRIRDAHNADCDAYEQRIAELERDLSICRESERILDGEKDEAFRQLTTEQYTIQSLTAELARVKAESLRVVKDGDARYWHCCEGVCLYDDGEPMLSFEGQYGSYSNRYPQRDEIVQPVMLELWDRPC
jgi:hypothetical protein